MATNYADVLQVASGEIGYKEPPSGITKYGEWYGIPDGNWCDMFISWCGDQAAQRNGGTNPIAVGPGSTAKGFAYTPTHAQSFRSLGTFYDMDTTGIRPGDIVFYNPSGARISHVGIVESVNSNGYVTLEGNHNNMAARVTHSHNEGKFAGYGRPAYDGTGAPASGSESTGGIGLDSVIGTASPIVVIVGLGLVGLIIVFTQIGGKSK